MDRAPGPLQRLFVAVPVPCGLEGFIREAQAKLSGVTGVRLLGPDQWHVTLAFIGEVDERKAAAARQVVESLPGDGGGDAVIGGLLFLPSPRTARVIALDVSDDAGVLASLFGWVAAGLEQAGVMEREKRAFRAHVTVARMRGPRVVQPMSEGARSRFAVESVCLYRSELRREGAVYTVVARKVLAAAKTREKA